MQKTTIEYCGFEIELYHDETESLWTAYMNHLIYETDHEPTIEEIEDLLCLELGIDDGPTYEPIED